MVLVDHERMGMLMIMFRGRNLKQVRMSPRQVIVPMFEHIGIISRPDR